MRVAARVVLAGAVLGVVSVGVVSRLMMFLLIRMNPDAAGLRTDDGFEMGRFTLSGSLNLCVVGLVFGLISAGLYLLLEPLMIGPRWFRTLSVSVGAGAVAASQLVHSDGIDFHVLDPYWFAVGLFVLLPIGHVAALDLLVRRVRAHLDRPAPRAPAIVGWPLRGGLAVLFVVAVGSLVGDVNALSDLNS